MKIFEFEQYSDEWWAIRLGISTASGFSNIITPGGIESKSKEKFLNKLAVEFLSGKSEETYKSAAMIRGSEMEAEARMFYEIVKGVEVKQVGFCLDEEYNAGCSPDGLIGPDGGLEIKCPIASTQGEYLLENKFPKTYIPQVQGSMFVTGRKWWDFMSYYPGVKPLLIRVERDEVFISKLRVELKLAKQQLEEVINKIR